MNIFSKLAKKIVASDQKKSVIIDEIPGQHKKDMEQRLQTLQVELATLIAHEKTAKRKKEDMEAEIERLEEYVIKSVSNEDDEQAKEFLRKKMELDEMLSSTTRAYERACENTKRMQELCDRVADERGVS